jgi:cold shock CspA family protein/ribosome-associated translation inhibitor RaiA
MQLPLQITFRNLAPSAAIDAAVRKRATRLERFYPRLMACRVVVESPHRRHHQGKVFHVRIDLTVPQGELLVSRDPAEHHAHEDVHVAIRDAFNAARRRLLDYARKQRGDVKAPLAGPRARVARLFPEQDHGFLTTPDGREIYFHKRSVLSDAFGRLAVGDEVAFTEEMGEQGPQASTVRRVGARRGAAAVE